MLFIATPQSNHPPQTRLSNNSACRTMQAPDACSGNPTHAAGFQPQVQVKDAAASSTCGGCPDTRQSQSPSQLSASLMHTLQLHAQLASPPRGNNCADGTFCSNYAQLYPSSPHATWSNPMQIDAAQALANYATIQLPVIHPKYLQSQQLRSPPSTSPWQ